MLTEIENGKRVIVCGDMSLFLDLDKISQFFKECKMEESVQGWEVDLNKYRYFSLVAKSGINKINVLIEMEHEYPHFYIAVNNVIKLQWKFSSNNPSIWICKSNLFKETEVLFDLLDKIREEWKNN